MQQFVKALFICVATLLLSGCASIASYSLTDNGCIKVCSPAEKRDYYLGTRLSSDLISSPVSRHDKIEDIGLKCLAVIDFPLTLAIDTVFVPFIAIRNLFF